MGVDHWYQLKVRTLSDHCNGRYGGEFEGPFDEKQLLKRVRQVLKAEPNSRGETPWYAQVFRVDVHSVSRWERKSPQSTKEWVQIGTSRNLNRAPKSLVAMPLVEQEEHGYLLLSVPRQGPPWLEFFLKFDIKRAAKVLGAKRPLGAEAQFVEVTMTPLDELGVDLMTIWNHPRYRRDKNMLYPPPNTREGEALRLDGKPIIGYRRWRLNVPSALVEGKVVDAEPRLFGPMYLGDNLGMFEWSGPEKHAECAHHQHTSPSDSCRCGIYAHHNYESLPHFGLMPTVVPSFGTEVAGAILGSGDILVHEEGWRAESATIVGFDATSVSPRFLASLRRLAQRFDVPILEPNALRAAALKRGRYLPKHLLEEL